MSLHINYITGYAGTGKSHTLQEQLTNLPPETTIVVAPTHKALYRLSPQSSEHTFKTIHSLLGWIPRVNEKATHPAYIQSIHKLDKPLDSYTNIVIDEAGMMSEDMLLTIVSKIEEAHDYNIKDTVTLTLYLDPYQLLPVKGIQIQTDPDTTTNLTTQYRSEAPDIVKTYTKFVHYLEGINTKDLTIPYSTNIKPLDITKFKEGDRLLAYTNRAVGRWNKIIAQHLNITSYIHQEVQMGNMLDPVTVDSFIQLTYKEILEAYETNTLILQNSKIGKQYIESSLKQLLHHKDIQFIQDINNYIYPVIVGIDNAHEIRQRAAEKAIKSKPLFRHVYTLNRAFTMDYSFASTVHKAQGSEFSTVFIDKEDIKQSIRNNYYNTYARLMYVALSRAINHIYLK